MSEIPGENNHNPYEGLTAEQKETLKAWTKQGASQSNNFAALSPEERSAWGIEPEETLIEKQARDERDAPSK